MSERPGALARARRDAAATLEYLSFRVGDGTFALPVSAIREIVRTSPITPVPRAPAWVLGVTSFRGRIVTVIDVGSRLALAEASGALARERSGRAPRLRVLMVDVGDETVGFSVDEVLVVHRLAETDVERVGSAIGSDVGDHVVGIARPESAASTEDEVLLLLDARALVHGGAA